MRGRSVLARTAAVAAASLIAGVLVPVLGLSSASAVTSVPRPDHIVIVLDENRAQTIVGSPEAPFISAIATDNANFTQSYAETHPSQPNYLALFSGSTQSVADDSCPHTFSNTSLGDQLIAAGVGFTGYSEDLPSVGFTGCTSGNYARKHNPWVNWPSIPASASQPMTAFPTDYSSLPGVSIVVPNLQHDMHDGTVAQGDTWLQNNMAAYISWAKSHNSLFILAFDEDDRTHDNRIPTIFAGARVQPGTYTETINHYNVLRTIQDAFGLAPLDASATASPILDAWTPDTGPVNTPPVAAFSSTCTQLTCTFDNTGSTDPDGTITNYNWTFGDNTTATGQNPTHTYTTAGTYPVTLTVTDNTGATTTINHPATPTAPANTPFANDTFNRTTTNGFGTADTGGTWTPTGTATNLSTTPGTGLITLPTPSTLSGAYLRTISRTDADITTTINIDKLATGSGTTIILTGRRISSGNEYRARIRFTTTGTITLTLTRQVANTETLLTTETTIPGLTYTPTNKITIRLQVTGTPTTTLRAKAWRTDTTEPGPWQTTTTDTTPALQNPGAIGIIGYTSSTVTNTPINIRIYSFIGRPTTAPANTPPVAAFSSTCTQLTCTFDNTGSTDPDGTITNYNWTFGDNTTATGQNPAHTYTTAGTYPVTLTVTDNTGATTTINHPATPTAPANTPPVAAFSSTCTQLTCTFDNTGSTDPDGTITNYNWTFGDNTTATGQNPAHTYTTAGTYPVTLTVTDNTGATTTINHPATPTSPANTPPVAAFSSTCTQLTCTFDNTGSTDPDGTITNYNWTFGDNTTATGQNPAHTYTTAGTYPVTLTVTDNTGATTTINHPATPTAPANTPFANDTFNRTTTNGFGTADTGGTWTPTGTATNLSTTPGTGLITLPTPSTLSGAYLRTISRTDADITTTINIDKLATGSGTTIILTGRRISSGNEYRARIRFTTTGTITLTLTRQVANTETLLTTETTIPGLTYTPTNKITIRLQVTGTPTTTLRAKAWRTDTTEPGPWQTTTTDTTPALQNPGAIGIIGYTSSTVTNTPINIRIYSFIGRPTGG